MLCLFVEMGKPAESGKGNVFSIVIAGSPSFGKQQAFWFTNCERLLRARSGGKGNGEEGTCSRLRVHTPAGEKAFMKYLNVGDG